MRDRTPSLTAIAATGLAVLLLLPTTSFAQLNGLNLKGDVGLKGGSQAPPGAYFLVPLAWFYTADALKDRNGNEVLSGGTLDAAVFGPGINVVTTKKLFGANYGFLALLPWANNRLQGGENLDSNPGTGISDLFVQPIILGWHQPRADFIAAYGIYMPTGRYEDGASNNTGLGMWAQEFTVGTTVYLNESRTFHAATTAAFDFQSKKKDSETKVGNILILEGGVGADFMGGGLTTGLAYYSVFKLTNDQFDARWANLLIRGKTRVWGLGPEVSLALASRKRGKIYGFLTVRYQWEVGAKTTTEGAVWNVLATFPMKPIPIP